MRILVHIGLNKCASTYIQEALAAARGVLLKQDVFVPTDDGRTAQYGLSRHYGFGPDAPGVTPRCLSSLVAEARSHGCTRMILSSEYLSLRRPAAIAALAADLAAPGNDARLVFFSREVLGWVQSLFNQYVRTVSHEPFFTSINQFVDHILKNRSADIAARYRAWAAVVGEEHIAHFRIEAGQPAELVLLPFRDFARIPIPPATGVANESMSPGALYLTALLRHAPAIQERNALFGAIATLDLRQVPVPANFLEIDTARRARLEAEVAQPLAALPFKRLNEPVA